MAGDEDAFSLLYKRRHPSLYRFALHMSGNTAVAEDVTQEVFMALIRDPGRFDPAKGTLAGFLFGVARNSSAQALGAGPANRIADWRCGRTGSAGLGQRQRSLQRFGRERWEWQRTLRGAHLRETNSRPSKM